jgi:glycosyltransferase involved in cell wall biosynthesis
MSIAAVLGVKDEVDLMAASIAHLRRIGVEQIIVSDYGSTDGTLDVLEAQRRFGDVSVMHVNPAAIIDYRIWSARELALAKRTGADWVVFLDVDEFWIPASGSLRECQHLTEADVLVVERFNVVLTSQRLLMPGDLAPANYGDLQLFTRRADHFRAYVEAHPEVPFITVMPGPKIMARPWAIEAVAPGHHGADASGPHVRRIAATDLLIAHVPFSTAGRFARKLENIRAEIVQHPAYFSGELAWHWSRWAQMIAPGEVEQEFARQVLADGTLELLRRAGSVRSAAEILADPDHFDCRAVVGVRSRQESLVPDLER